MGTKIYKLYASNGAAATANAAAQLQIARGGFITGWRMGSFQTGATNGESSRWELSIASTGQQQTNDAVGPIDEFWSYVANDANGTHERAVNVGHTGVAIPVQAGDRLYLNCYGSANQSYAYAYVYVSEK